MGPLIRFQERRGAAVKFFSRASPERRRSGRGKKNPFRGYVPGPQDVFVMTYAKSGTNWMMQIAHQLIYHGKGEYNHLHDVVPWPDTTIMPFFMKKYAIPLEEATHWEQSPERKRVIKTHYNWDMLPYSDQARYIAVIRDPKDIFVSNYLFVRDGVYGRAMPTVDTWFDLFLSPHFPLGGSWAVNTAGYWAERHRPNVLDRVVQVDEARSARHGREGRRLPGHPGVGRAHRRSLPALVVRVHEGRTIASSRWGRWCRGASRER